MVVCSYMKEFCKWSSDKNDNDDDDNNNNNNNNNHNNNNNNNNNNSNYAKEAILPITLPPNCCNFRGKKFQSWIWFPEFFRVLAGWNVMIICELWNYLRVSVLKFEIEIPWSIFLTSR